GVQVVRVSGEFEDGTQTDISLFAHNQTIPLSLFGAPVLLGAAAADFDGDGDLDLVLAQSSAFLDSGTRLAVIHNHGDGNFQPVSFPAYDVLLTQPGEAVTDKDFGNGGTEPDFLLSADRSVLTLDVGGTATTTVSTTALNGFQG